MNLQQSSLVKLVEFYLAIYAIRLLKEILMDIVTRSKISRRFNHSSANRVQVSHVSKGLG